MEEYKLIIPGRLPGLNEYTAANRTNPYKGSSMKSNAEKLIICSIKTQIKGVHIKHPVSILYRFYEPNKRRDLDNISSFAHKVIQDSFVKTGVLINDGWKEITGYKDEFYCDNSNPRIEVYLTEQE